VRVRTALCVRGDARRLLCRGGLRVRPAESRPFRLKRTDCRQLNDPVVRSSTFNLVVRPVCVGSPARTRFGSVRFGSVRLGCDDEAHSFARGAPFGGSVGSCPLVLPASSRSSRSPRRPSLHAAEGS
jgi:hypothetical protein